MQCCGVRPDVRRKLRRHRKAWLLLALLPVIATLFSFYQLLHLKRSKTHKTVREAILAEVI